MKQLLLEYTKYNLWANTKLLSFIEDAISKDTAILDKEVPSSFNTLRKTVYHIYDAEFIWYSRLNGESPTDYPSVAAGLQPATGKTNFSLSDLSHIQSLLLTQSQKFIDYVTALDEKTLLSGFEYTFIEPRKPFKNKIWQSIHHCMNHSTFHRGQLITMLWNLGYTDLHSSDYITYIREES